MHKSERTKTAWCIPVAWIKCLYAWKGLLKRYHVCNRESRYHENQLHMESLFPDWCFEPLFSFYSSLLQFCSRMCSSVPPDWGKNSKLRACLLVCLLEMTDIIYCGACCGIYSPCRGKVAPRNSFECSHLETISSDALWQSKVYPQSHQITSPLPINAPLGPLVHTIDSRKAAAGQTGVLALKLRPSHVLFSHTQADKTTSAHAFCNEQQQMPARSGRKTEMGWGVTPAHTKTHTISTASAPSCW